METRGRNYKIPGKGKKKFNDNTSGENLYMGDNSSIDVHGENLYMGDNSSIDVHGKGQVELLFTSGNTLVLKDVYFAPDISRNLVSGPILNRLGYKLVFDADRCIISKCNFFIGHAYLSLVENTSFAAVFLP